MSLRTQRNSIPLLRFEWKQQYTEEGWYQFYRDDFNNDALGSEWKTHGLNVHKTIKELAGVVTIAIANNASGVWYCNVANVAPKMYMQIQQKTPCGVVGIAPPFRITTKLLDYEPAPDDTQAGIFIGTDPEGLGDVNSHLAFLFGRWRCDTCGWNACVKLDRNCGAYDPMGGVPCLPKWLMIDIDASEDIRFYFGDDGLIWTQYKHLGAPFVLSGEYADPIQVGLFVKNGIYDPVAGGTANISAQFEFFLIEAYGERLIDDCVAPIDVRAPNSFYDGRIKSMSSLKRSIDDRTGLFQITDLNVTLKNPDKKYSKMLATHQMKNREAILYHAWTEEDEASKSHMITLIVDDYELRGPEFHVKLKDITQKYFSKKIPENICTEIDFPNIHPDHIGRYMPEILGNASLSPAYAHPGAVEAVYVDTTGPPFRCLASAGLITIPANEVWIGDVKKTDGSTPPDPVQYSVVYSGGRTYIHFVAGQDPGDDTITFNAHGYSVLAWDSGNGYIQNLAYIILYFLQYTMGVPTSLLNTASFDMLAAYYVALGVGEQCYLIIQDEEDAMEILRELLFTGGAKGFLAKDGRFKVERKDVGNWQISSSDYHIFDQIELFSPSKRQWNLVNAINTVKVEFGYIPWQNMFTGIREDYEENFYDGRQEDHIRRERRKRGERRI